VSAAKPTSHAAEAKALASRQARSPDARRFRSLSRVDLFLGDLRAGVPVDHRLRAPRALLAGSACWGADWGHPDANLRAWTR
jgi:hypothetical protein